MLTKMPKSQNQTLQTEYSFTIHTIYIFLSTKIDFSVPLQIDLAGQVEMEAKLLSLRERRKEPESK